MVGLNGNLSDRSSLGPRFTAADCVDCVSCIRHRNIMLYPMFVRREPGRDEKILRDHRQDGNVPVSGIGNLAC